MNSSVVKGWAVAASHALVAIGIDGDELLKKSSLVVLIGGTTGFEAAFYGKSSITFSDMIYSLLPSVFRVQNIDELSNTIKTALNTKVYSQDLDRYISLLENEMFSFDSFEFTSDLKDELFLGGNLHDNTISEKQIQKILTKHESLLKKLTEEVSEYAKIEIPPKPEGRQIMMILVPHLNK